MQPTFLIFHDSPEPPPLKPFASNRTAPGDSEYQVFEDFRRKPQLNHMRLSLFFELCHSAGCSPPSLPIGDFLVDCFCGYGRCDQQRDHSKAAHHGRLWPQPGAQTHSNVSCNHDDHRDYQTSIYYLEDVLSFQVCVFGKQRRYPAPNIARRDT